MSEFALRVIYFKVKPKFRPFLIQSSGIWKGIGAMRHYGGACGDDVLGGEDSIGGPNHVRTMPTFLLFFLLETFPNLHFKVKLNTY